MIMQYFYMFFFSLEYGGFLKDKSEKFIFLFLVSSCHVEYHNTMTSGEQMQAKWSLWFLNINVFNLFLY